MEECVEKFFIETKKQIAHTNTDNKMSIGGYQATDTGEYQLISDTGILIYVPSVL